MMLADYTPDDRKSRPGALAYRFGGEKRAEDPREIFCRDAQAAVVDGYLDRTQS